MKKLFIILFGILFITCNVDKKQSKTLLANSKNITYTVNGSKGMWTLMPELEIDILSVEAKKKINKVWFKSAIDSILFEVTEKDSIVFDIVINGKDTARTGIVGKPKIIYNHDPLKAVIHTEDIHNFWKAYYLANGKSEKKQKDIYKEYYFDIASKGMKDYFTSKIDNDVEYFVKHINNHPKYYNYIKENTLKVDTFKPQIIEGFKKLKDLYPNTYFPDVYCGIGAFTSAGTVSDNGLLLGINQICDTPDTPKKEFSFGNLTLLSDLKSVPSIIAHELIHFQQNEMARDTITLSYVINEGMADFVSELTTNQSPNPKLYNWAKGKEKRIWNNFKKDMYFNRYENWIANASTATEDNYADQGYWIGYQICKSYYENSIDKKQAIYDMFHIQDYRDFLSKSKWEEKIKQYD